jgi:glycosyltransferase involved in cell wall biosynthesis
MTDMAKVLHVCGLDSFVGAFQPLLDAMMEQGHEVDCACTDTGHFAKLRQRGMRMIHMPVVRKLQAPSNLKTIYRLYRLIRQERYDVVHTHNPIASVLGRIAAKLAGCKTVVYTSHGFYFHELSSKPNYLVFYWLEKMLARLFTDQLLLVSREDYELCLQHRFKEPERVHHISNGVDVYGRFNPAHIDAAATQALRMELGFEERDIVIGYVGRLIPEKGIPELVQAYRRLKRKHARVRLLLIGGVYDSERDRSLLEAIPGFRDEGIVNVGFRSDIPELLAGCDIFVLPSHREGMPLSILEAMAMGKPVVATNIRGCREEVEDGRNGYLFPVKDVEALCDRLDRLVSDPGRSSEFGRVSRDLAMKHYAIQPILSRQLEIYDRMIPEGPVPALTDLPSYHS